MEPVPYRDGLNRIVILNPKGGCGKSTLAINLASYYASRGPAPTLVDTDPRGFSTQWLERRPKDRPHVNHVAAKDFSTNARWTWPFRTATDAGAAIIDTPAGVDDTRLRTFVHGADCILVPILPSRFDIDVTTRFIAELLLITDFECPVGVVANRTRMNTKSLALLHQVLASLEVPTIAVLRDAQSFLQAAEFGLGICELPHYEVKQEIEQIARIVEWLDHQLMKTFDTGLLSRLYPVQTPFNSRSSELSQPG